MKYFFPIHLDGGNRGCEAIAKSSAILLDEKPNHLVGYCKDVALDTRLGLQQYISLIPFDRGSLIVDRLLGAINKVFHTTQTATWRQLYPYKRFLQLITSDDIVISTGGDMMCYDNNAIIYTTNWLKQQGVKSILWGCSMGAENMTPEKLDTLHRFSLIYTRESLTYDYFQSLGLPNLCLLPDPAFILPAEHCELPACLSDHEIVGLNISNYVMGGMTLEHPFGQEVIRLITYILHETDMQILLIPHVTWNREGINQDDRQMADIIADHFNNPERIRTLDIENLNYCQIRYAISKCKLFIGARTHSVISAYSMCVPTLALGYSIKSRGIAKDLGLNESLVVNCHHFQVGDLLHSFTYLMQHETDIREHLQQIMPEYKQKPYEIRKLLKNI